MKNIYPTSKFISREEKQLRLGQRAKVFWMTGLSGSGKSTLATALERKLFDLGYHAVVLDGDNIRGGINNNLTFSPEDRIENIRRVAEVAKLIISSGQICIVSFISPTIEMRQNAKQIIGEHDFIEVFIDTPIEICESRDVKGLYKKARAGEISDFTGVNAPYEAPVKPDIHIETKNKKLEESFSHLYEQVLPFIQW
ncbi:MAG: adenylyl-sulfate kinase [Saprospiraceae bacterium]|uniref:Adenylyl-sulfate kinase n=1 Tax=Candidatus Opimibacter skivensis TaxID=2982028 RepID=A0A9D7XU83_9BACT|nr:adenylyl-sulfate kinase [Candidatus Opimibacter skivensis]